MKLNQYLAHAKTLHLSLALMLCLSCTCLAQTGGTSYQPTPGAPNQPTDNGASRNDDERPNGISVGRPKVFDNRTLTLMLESLSESLRSIQFVDKTSLAAAFNLLQGAQSREVVSNLSVSTLPLPSLHQEDTATTGNATTSGTPLPDTTSHKTTTDRSAITPQPPSLDTLPAFSGFNPTYGESPSDLLSDQVNLTYQIFNLRMLLERSLSDRVLSNEEPRRQAVLGFNVTIDPPRTSEDAVAVVKVTLEVVGGSRNDDGISLVSLMPQEKTYNAAALSTKSRAFGGAAVAKMIQVGYSERHRGQVFYLYRDNDTVSYERMNGGDTSRIVFGWMFRPVLGRRSVSPGLRQLFAIVSLPIDDKPSNHEKQILKATVQTYWKKYDRNTMTSFDEDDANRAARLKYALSFNLSKPEIFNSRYVNTATYHNIEVKPTAGYENDLLPKVDNVWWVPVGNKSALVSINGHNFFSSTQVTMGDKLYATPSDGLIIKSSQAMDIVAGLDALASGSAAIIGRYGHAVPVPLLDQTGGASDGIKLGVTELGPSLSGNHSLKIELRSLTNTPLSLNDLPKSPGGARLTPIVTVNGNVIPLPYSFAEELSGNGVHHKLILQATVPDSALVNGGGIIKVTWPFRSDKWTATTSFYDPTSTYRAIRLGQKKIMIMTTDPSGFVSGMSDPCWVLLAGEEAFKLTSTTCKEQPAGVERFSDFAVQVTLSNDAPDKVALVSPDKYVYSVDVPKAAPAEPAGPKPVELKQFDSVWIDIEVKDVSKVENVEANQLPLQRRKAKPGKDGQPAKAIQVEITRAVTAKPGDVDVTVTDKEGNVLGGARLHIIPCEKCDGGNND